MKTTEQTEYAELAPSEAQGIWFCRFTSRKAKAEAMRLFGTNVIPTAFTTVCSYDEVRAALAAIPANRGVCFVEACSIEESARR